MEHVKWNKTDKDSWTADVGESVPARIKQLDAKTFCVYRNGRYLGSEGDLSTAQQRAALNMRSEVNREMEWQRNHPDEQPLGLRLTQEERALERAPPKPAPRSKPKAGGLEVLLNKPDAPIGEIPEKVGRLVPPPKPKAAPAPVVAKEKAPKGNRDTELLTLLKRGCTTEEVLRVTGWQAISMPQLAKRLGVGLRIDKSCKPFKYYGE